MARRAVRSIRLVKNGTAEASRPYLNNDVGYRRFQVYSRSFAEFAGKPRFRSYPCQSGKSVLQKRFLVPPPRSPYEEIPEIDFPVKQIRSK